MTSANLALVRSICAPWRRGDYSAVDWAASDIEFVSAGGPETGTSTGLAGMRQRVRDELSPWERLRVEAYEFHKLDDTRVLVFVRFTGKGKRSGLEIGRTCAKGACVFHLRAGKVTRLEHYFDCDCPSLELRAGIPRVQASALAAA